MRKLMCLFLILIFTFTSFAQDSKKIIAQQLLNYTLPQSSEQFNPLFHLPPVNQGETNICWSFATLSFIESELYRMGYVPIRLSVTFPAYYAFIEKAKYFVQCKGTSRFKAGDLFPIVLEVVQKYGIVPDSVYTGLKNNNLSYNHKSMEAELEDYMKEVKANATWDENLVVKGVEMIMRNHIGSPPQNFNYKGINYTPKSFADKHVNLNWNEYILVTSFNYAPFYSYTTLNVPDNWRHIDRYFNVPLDLFYSTIRKALQKGFTLAIDGDFSEPGRYGPKDVALIPAFDIPSNYITQEAREYRFEYGITSDDHLMHVVGYNELNGEDWFLVKDSWKDAFEGNNKGYFFYRHDYTKLKILAYLVHQDAIPEIVQRLPQ
jgi:bleomycin hydrolase